MKANRKFRGDDEAVSPVIAVILMVAITVVLAATVYVWVSGFGSQSSQPAKTMSLTSSGSLTSDFKSYTVASATSGMRYQDVTVSIDGTEHQLDTATACTTVDALADATSYRICSGGATKAATATVAAGDRFDIADVQSGDTLRILDSQANSVILTLTLG